jgi:hypothetical protein
MGPPGSGKTTYANERAGPSDLVVDYDAISQSLGPQEEHGAAQGRHKVVMAARNAILREIRRGEVDANTIYILSANPNAETMFPHHDVVLLDPGREEVLRRVSDERPVSFSTLVDNWYGTRERQSNVREW